MPSDVMNMKPIAAAIAGGLTGIALSALCAALVAAFPLGFAQSYGRLVFHGLDISSLMAKPQFGLLNLFLGFVYAFLTGFVIGGAFAYFYNWTSKLLK